MRIRCRQCDAINSRSYNISSKEKLKKVRNKVRYKAKTIAIREQAIKKQTKSVRESSQKARDAKREAQKQINWLETAIAHIIKDDSWNKSTSKQVHLEIIVRAIMSYRKLEQEGIVAFSEFAFLIAGSQFEYFSRKEIELRTGYMKYFNRDLKACIDAGLIIKIEKKKLYYLTLAGKERFDAILGHIYREKGLGTKVYRTRKNEINK